MAVSEVDICNLALGHLRQPPLVSFDEFSPEGDACRTFYRQAVDTALRAYDWPFARSVASLGAATPNPMPGWAYAYPVGVDVLAVRRIVRGPSDEGAIPFVLMRLNNAPAIFTNQPAAGVVYTARVDDVPDYSPDFVAFLSLHLAAMLAMPLTGKPDMATILRKQVEEAGQRAASAAGDDDFNGESQGAMSERDAALPPSTAVAISNLALGHIGADPIKSFGERTRAADAVRRFYRQSMDTTLRAIDWPFARRYALAAPIGASVVPGFALAYEYPADAIAIRQIARADELSPPVPYRIVRDASRSVIVTNATAPVLHYTCRPNDEDDLDPEFVSVVALQLAMAICMPVRGKADLLPALSKLSSAAMDRAWADAANEDTNDIGEDPVPDFLAVRGVQSLTRSERALAWGVGRLGGLPAITYLPNESGAPAPAMLTGAPSQIERPYIPGLTAPPEKPLGELITSDFAADGSGVDDISEG